MVISTHKINVMTIFTQKGRAAQTRAVQKVNKDINRQAHEFSNLSKKQRITRNNTEMNRVAQQGFARTMRMNREGLRDFNAQGRKFNTMGGKMASGARMMTHGMKGFKMEMLGVMFFGMMLGRVLKGLLKTSLEWTGVTEILSTTLGLLFLPVAFLVLEWAIKFLEIVSNLTEAQKLLIGKFVLMGIAIGGILFIIGTFALGIGSMFIAFGFLFSKIGLVLGIFALLGAAMFIKDDFFALGQAVENADAKLATFGISGNLLTGLLNGLKEKLPMLRDFFLNLKDKIGGWIGKILPVLMEQGGLMLTSIVNGLLANVDKIAEAVTALFDNIGTYIDENYDELVEFGVRIGKAILKGFSKTFIIIGKEMGETIVEDMRRMTLAIGEQQRNLPRIQEGLPGIREGAFPTERITITNNFSGFTNDDLQSSLDIRDSSIVQDVRRVTII